MSPTTKQTGKYKRSPCNHDNEPPAKRFKGDESQILLAEQQIPIVIPVMAHRLPRMLSTYCCWRSNGFVIVLVFKEDERKEIITKLQQHGPFELHSYKSNPSNAGIAKKAAYDYILQNYVNDPRVVFALLLDDTVNKIVNTCTGKSIMTNPTEFYNTTIKFAQISPVFGGTVAYKRHPEKCTQSGINRVKGAFLQQALVFSCRGAPTLTKHFTNVEEYVMKMRRLSYRSVPFGEDVSFQIALYEHGIIISKGESAQFWGLGVSRNTINHKSATKPSFNQLDDKVKKALKDMMIYLKEQGALSINRYTKKLTGVKVIPGGRIRIRIRGRVGERPWSAAFDYTFPETNEI